MPGVPKDSYEQQVPPVSYYSHKNFAVPLLVPVERLEAKGLQERQ
jgi:hypothetical protein